MATTLGVRDVSELKREGRETNKERERGREEGRHKVLTTRSCGAAFQGSRSLELNTGVYIASSGSHLTALRAPVCGDPKPCGWMIQGGGGLLVSKTRALAEGGSQAGATGGGGGLGPLCTDSNDIE